MVIDLNRGNKLRQELKNLREAEQGFTTAYFRKSSYLENELEGFIFELQQIGWQYLNRVEVQAIVAVYGRGMNLQSASREIERTEQYTKMLLDSGVEKLKRAGLVDESA